MSEQTAMSALPSRRSIGSGLLLGIAGGAWNAIIAFLCVPWIVRLLGIERYGLIGFFVTLQATIGLLDLGVGATVNREVARSTALGDLDHARRLLRSLELVYAGVAAVIATGIALAAPLIGRMWLNPAGLEHGEVATAVCLMGIVAALRWPLGLYFGALIGLHRPQISYRITAAMATFASIGAILVLTWVQRTIAAYFLWQAAVALLALLWARHSAWHALGGPTAIRPDHGLLRTVIRRSAMMSGVAMTGVILSQIDKFVVSMSVTLADFGRYSLAAVLAGGLTIMYVPASNVIYPRLSALVAAGRHAEQVAFYRWGTRLFLACLFPITFSAFFYVQDLLALWTGKPGLAASVAPIAGTLFLGFGINGVMLFPYALHLATGQTRRLFLIGCGLVAVMPPLTIMLVSRYGALGGAWSWLSLNAVNLVLLVAITHIHLLPGIGRRWIVQDVVPALAIALVVVGAGQGVAGAVGLDHVARLAIAATFSIIATIGALLVYPGSRKAVGTAWRGVQPHRWRTRA